MKRAFLLLPFGCLFGCLAVLGDFEPSGEKCKNGEVVVTKDEACNQSTDGTAFPEVEPKGLCKRGTWFCQPSGKAVCVGAVGPAAEDCTTADIDEDCDGQPLTGCECEPGQVRACGVKVTKPELKGACKSGSQVCGADHKFAACQGAIDPKPRNCASAEDNDCNGEPDRYEAACDCKEGGADAAQGLSGPCKVVGKVGACENGLATCGVDPTDSSKGKFGACVGALPGPKACGAAGDNDCNGKPDKDEPECKGCAGAPPAQTFANGMYGCSGKVTFDQRTSLCGAGCNTCTAAQWVNNSSGAAPTHHYWTNDLLKYTSGSGGGADNFSCSVTSGGIGSDCGALTPMRVCVDLPTCSLPGCAGGPLDPEGNACNWSGCGLDNLAVNHHFGGCGGNTTAGTLCCCP